MIVRNLWGCFKSSAVLGLVLPMTACSLEGDVGASVTDGGTGARTATASISWIAPDQREDGIGLSMSEIGGYRIHYGEKEGDYPNKITIDDGTATEGKVTIPHGDYFVVVTVYDVDGRESAFSSPALKIQV